VIAVTGATGKVGRLVADELARRGAGLRLLVRNADRAPDVSGAEVVEADYGDPDSLARALRAGDSVFMVSIHDGPERRPPLHRSFVAAATRAEVGRIVYLSFVNAGPDAVFLHARSHGETEAMLRASGVPWTAIRKRHVRRRGAGLVRRRRVAREPVGDGRISFSFRPELAQAIAVTLTERPRGARLRHHDARVGHADRAGRDRHRCDRAPTPLRARHRRRLGRALGGPRAVEGRGRPHVLRRGSKRRARCRERRLPGAHRARPAAVARDRAGRYAAVSSAVASAKTAV
jgi:uncharacterized protein YbjT (DUF2867 family)